MTKIKPAWLDKKINLRDCGRMKALLRGLGLYSVCEAAACPNISECFSRGIATFMILGGNCTRGCKFCNVQKHAPCETDDAEPGHVAEAVKRLGLSHVVITSVTRDDLQDGGAGHFARTICSVRSLNNGTSVEVLIPDFKGHIDDIDKIVQASPVIIGHNVETVPRLYPRIRPEADYNRSLAVLEAVKTLSQGAILAKSGIMLGLGENDKEVLEVLADLRRAGCDFLSIGQYLPPSKRHYPVKNYISPDIFEYYKIKAKELGFKYTASAPYVRSSYRADEYINPENQI
ncbi:MAG: lipoyl synthase [Candidatus Omnitrophica bacterium]|nr:lipoyl synthase [Candidatus Omnitrophota bacterium]